MGPPPNPTERAGAREASSGAGFPHLPELRPSGHKWVSAHSQSENTGSSCRREGRWKTFKCYQGARWTFGGWQALETGVGSLRLMPVVETVAT